MNAGLSEYEAILTCPPAEFASRLGKLFLAWRHESDATCKRLMPLIERHLPCPHPALSAALQAALSMADEPGANAYHNHVHNREVCALTLALLIRHRHAHFMPAINDEMAYLTIMAACIHDYRHDGSSNRQNGRVEPLRLERLALEAAKPRLLAAGLSPQQWLKISMIVLPTDITHSDKPCAAAQLKAIYNYANGLSPLPDTIDPLFLSFLYDHPLTCCAEILGDADLGVSASLDITLLCLNSKGLEQETKGAIPYTSQSFHYFLTQVCYGFPGSGAGKMLLGPGFETICAHNAQAMDLGLSTKLG